MNIRKTIITAIVSLTMVAMIAPVSVGAVTIADLQAQINALLAQLAILQGQTTTTTGSAPAVCSGVTFTRNLRVGATGSDVKCLQALLNTSATTQVSTTGAGSPGNETSYFGSLTLAAVKKYQAEQGWTPASQVGPLTRAKLNTWLGGGSGVILPPVIVPTGAGLSVMLASDNPAAGSIVGVTGSGSALNSMLKLTFLNGDNAEVKVTGLKLKRVGIAADASITNTYLFNGATRLTDGSAVSETVVNFNSSAGLFMVPAGGSTTISVLANVDGAASETVAFQVVEATSVTSNASSVKGTYPITGNLMTIADGTLAGVEWNDTTTPTAASVDPQNEYTVFQNSVVVTTRAVDLKRISFKKTGSVALTDLQNFKLYIDGVQVGSTMQLTTNTIDAGNYVTFDLMSAPKRLEAGTRVVKVLADIIGGSNLNFTMHLWNVADVTVVDTQYNANVLSDLVSDGTFSKRSTGEQTVNTGTITFTKKTDSPSGDIVNAASNALFGKWEVKAAGEKVKIETLNVRVIFGNTVTTGDNDTSSTGDITIRNGKLLANGVQVGSTTSTINGAAGTQFSLGSSLIVDPLSPVTLEFWGDVYDNKGTVNDIDSTDTLQASVVGSSTNNNATGQTSAVTIDAPASNVSANVMTVRQGTLSLSKYTAYTNHTAVAPLTAYKLGHYTLTAATSEGVNITAIVVALDEVSTYTTNLYVKYGDKTTSVKPTITASNTWSINHTLPAGQTIDLMVFGDIAKHIGATGTVTVNVDGTTSSSAVTANGTALDGQDITYSDGSLVTAFDGTPQNQAVSGNQSVLAGTFKLTSSYQSFTTSELRFSANSNAIVISSATLKDTATGTTLGTAGVSGGGDFRFTGLSINVPPSTSKRVGLYWNLAVPSATNSSWNLNTVAALTYIKYTDPDGTETIDSTTTRPGNETYVYRAVPTLTQVDLLNTAKIANGAPQDLYKFTVTAPAQGPIDIKQFKLDLTWTDTDSAGSNLELESLKLLKDGIDITSSVDILDEDLAGDRTGTNGVSEATSKMIITWKAATESVIPAGSSATYTIRGTPQGFGGGDTAANAADSVSLNFVADAAVSAKKFLNVGSTLTGILKLHSAAAAGISTATDYNLIWSDESAVAHTAGLGTASTGDWTNSYLVLNVLGGEAWTK